MDRLISLMLLLNVVHSGTCSNQVWILKYNREINCPNPNVGVSIESNSVIKEFTFCGKYNFKFLAEGTTLMSLGGTDIFIEMNHFGDEQRFSLKYDGGYYFFYFQNQTLIPNEWYQICLAVSLTQLKVALNGEILSNEIVDLNAKDIEKTTLWFGVQKHSKFESTKRMEGMITDAYLWNKSLNMNQLNMITSNELITDLPQPDLFKWPASNQKSNQPCYEYLRIDENDELLQNNPPKKVLLVENYENFNSANFLCQAYGGELFVPNNDESWSKLTTLFKKSGNCSFAYLGLRKSDNIVVDINGKDLSFFKWGKNQPNGKNWQQCITASFDGKELTYDDRHCDNEFCYTCKIPSKNNFKLRGNIPNQAEREYFVGIGTKSKDTNVSSWPMITGFEKTNCFWNGTWLFGQHLRLENLTSNMPPVGTQKWNKNKLLKFTQCNDDEYTCHNYGNCISMTKRCDGHPDCPKDGSDENKCEMITLFKGYDNKYSQGKNAINISISMDVYSIEEINELEMKISIKVRFTMKWLDSRLTFRNLKYTDFYNQLNIEEIKKIWTPSLLFLSSKGTYIKAEDGTVLVKKNGSKQLNELSELDEDYLYSGNENPISMVTYTHVKLDCTFDLTMYPFDSQRCPIKLAIPHHFYGQFVMNWENAPTIRHMELNEYENLNELGYDDTNTSMTVVKVEIILCRKISYQIVNIYIPTLCIMMISVFTLYIDFSHFEATIMVALTSMLVMHTLYQGTSQYLPHTSYMKMIDVWLFGGLILPFLSITILIMMDYLVNNEANQVIDMKKEKKIRFNSKLFIKSMQIFLPIFSGTFCIIYWIIGLYHHYHDCSV